MRTQTSCSRHAIARASLKSWGALVLCLLALACQRDVAKAPQAEPSQASVTELAKAAPSKAASNEFPKPVAQVDAPPAAANNQISRAELIDVLCQPDVVRATPEQTAERLAKAGALERKSIVPEVLQLKGEVSDHATTISYGQDGKGGWLFSSLRMELRPAASESQAGVYTEVDDLLRAKLKKPRWSVPAEGELVRSAYRVGKTLELILSACKSDAGHGVVCLELGEPQGEPH